MEGVLIRAGSFLLIIVLGYVLKRARFFKPDDYRLVSKIILNVTLPASIAINFSGTKVSPWLLFIAFLGIGHNLILWASAFFFSRRASWDTKKFRMINYPGCSIGCFTLPFIQSFLGPSGVVATCLFDAGNSILCTGGTYAVVSEMDSRRKGEASDLSGELKSIGKKLLRSVPLMTYVVMLILSFAGLELPGPVLTFGGIIADANAFLSMFMIGMMFEIRLKPEKLREMVRLLAWRYALAAALALCFYFLLPFEEEVRQTLAIVSFSPLSTLALVFTDRLDCDTELASATNSVTILISLAVMTGLVTLFAV